MVGLQKDQSWKQAVIDFLAEDPKPGHLITEKWKQDHFNIHPPTMCSIEQLKTYQLHMLNAFESFAKTLLEDYQIHLKSDRRGGHTVLAPKEQTGYAVDECGKDIKKALRKTRVKLTNVAVDLLTQDERKEHTDAQVRLAMQASMFRKTKRVTLMDTI